MNLDKVYRVTYKFKPQDSIVYSSVLHHLASAGGVESCFINRNRRDFDDPDIEESLANQGCKMLFSLTATATFNTASTLH